MSTTYHRFRQQLLYAIILVVVIPLILIINTVRLNMGFTDTLDRELQQKGILLASSIGTFVNDYTNHPDVLQGKLLQAKSSESNIREITIYRLYNDQLAVLASTESSQEMKTLLEPQNIIAWQEKKPTAELDPASTDSNRIWTITAPIFDSSVSPIGLLNIRVSTADIDGMVQRNNQVSLIYLAISCLIVLALLVNHFFYIGYAKQLQGVRQINRMKDAFITSISVGLQNPIIEIKNYAAMLHRGYSNALDEQGSGLVHGILTDATKLYTMVTDLLEISQVDRGEVSINRQQFNPMTICQEVYEQLQMTAHLKGVQLNHYISGTQAIIVADPDRFRQAFFNILNLTIYHTKTGSIDVNYEYDDQRNLEIVVHSHDLVFDQMSQAKIFHRPLEESEAMAEWYSDFGITYWASKRVIENMQGQLEEESRPGLGTVFHIHFAARPIDIGNGMEIHATIASQPASSPNVQPDGQPIPITPSPIAFQADTPPAEPPQAEPVQPWAAPAQDPVPVPSENVSQSPEQQGINPLQSSENRFSLPPE